LKPTLPAIIGILLLLGLLSACAANQEPQLKMASISILPPEVKAAPVSVLQSYQFAVANPEVLGEIPCYCGCAPAGHRSNYDCYISSVDSSGVINFDNHSLGCSICVDITQDAMRLLREGRSVPEIKSYVDNTYSRYGPSNMP
jgi:hypothetical protein